MINRIVILGAGNLAWHFVEAVSSTNIEIVQIFSNTLKSAACIGKKYNIDYTNNLEQISKNTDLYLFLLNDSGTKNVLENFPYKNKIMLHCSGGLSIDIFKNHTNNYGVFYPYQTIKKEIKMDFSEIPIFIESSNNKTKKELILFANALNCQYYYINTEERKVLHVAAVFSCNFMNHCIHLGEILLANNNIDSKLLKPLLEQSFKNILNYSAEKSQTGPALRNDNIIIDEHIKLLKNNKLFLKAYKLLTKSIIETNRKKI